MNINKIITLGCFSAISFFTFIPDSYAGVTCRTDTFGTTRCSNGQTFRTDSFGTTRDNYGNSWRTDSFGTTRGSNGTTCRTDTFGTMRCYWLNKEYFYNVLEINS